MNNLTAGAPGAILDRMLAQLDTDVRSEVTAAIDALLRLVAGLGTARTDAIDAVRAARQLADGTDAAMSVAVARARSAGRTWTEIGVGLGCSRQAAFQRFGRTGNRMTMTETTAAGSTAVQLFTALAAGDFSGVHGTFDEQMAASLGVERLAGLWADVTGMMGQFEGARSPVVRRVGDHVVVDVPLDFVDGEMTGRISLDDNHRVAGLFVLDPAAR